ncbi:MAG TPA: hypothetical protein VKZ53_27240 [Candidatus Angelobacter sp.]|nr:hypothetical protein [Candidatus Angelobacter sp.]
MKVHYRVVALTILAVVSVVSLFANSPVSVTEKPFVSGGRIEVKLEGGDYEIRAADGNRIKVSFGGNVGSAKAALNTNGSHADLAVTQTPNDNFHAVIEVPAASDLTIRLTAGNLKIDHIVGNKDIESHAGNVEVAVGDAAEYARAEGSVSAGNIEAPAFDASISKGGLFRSFKWSGQGKYSLRAHLGAGNLELRK